MFERLKQEALALEPDQRRELIALLQRSLEKRPIPLDSVPPTFQVQSVRKAIRLESVPPALQARPELSIHEAFRQLRAALEK